MVELFNSTKLKSIEDMYNYHPCVYYSSSTISLYNEWYYYANIYWGLTRDKGCNLYLPYIFEDRKVVIRKV